VVGRSGSRPPTTEGGASAPVALGRTANLTYTPTAALRQETVRRCVAKLQPINPAAAQAVTKLFGPGKGDYGQVYQTLVRRSGLAENDVADALAVFAVVGYMAVNNMPSAAVTPAMMRGVRTQMAQVLTTNETFATPGAAARFGEQTKLQAVIMQGGWQAAIQQHTLPAYQRSTDALFSQQFGLHFTELGLTEQGFVRR
jgi:hypothetical protein